MAARRNGRGHARPRPQSPQLGHSRRTSLVLLGDFTVCDGTGSPVRLPLAGQRLVALTALHGAPLPRHLAASRLWPHLPSVSARGSLRNAISGLQAACPGLIAADASTVRLADTVDVDIWQREAQALRVLQRDGGDPRAEEPFEGMPLLLPAWEEEWVAVERLRLQELLLYAHEAQAARLLRRGEFALAVAAVYEVLRVDPLRESAAQLLVSAHLAEGNRAQAARCYLEFRGRLHAALGIEPSGDLRKLVAGLLRTGSGQ